MSATQPIPMFSGSVLTSIKGAAIIHHDDGIVGGQCGCVRPCCLGPLVRPWIAKHRHKVYMRMSTSSGNNRFGANKKVTKTRRWQMAPNRTGEQMERWESFVSFLCM
jgi:hypothetical protein